MGLRFDIRAANWVAYLTDWRRPLPRLGERGEEVQVLRMLLNTLQRHFYSTPEYQREFRGRARHALSALADIHPNWQQTEYGAPIAAAVRAVRGFFRGTPWTALLVPSMTGSKSDELLASERFLRDLVNIRPGDPGLIFQLDEPPLRRFFLTDVFPAFKTALAESNHWPGVLLWNRSGDSQFFPLPEEERPLIDAARWLFARLADPFAVDLEALKIEYLREIRRQGTSTNEITIVHLSDIHLGSQEASRRIIRVQQLIRNLVEELGDDRRLIFAVSGDLMDDPVVDNLDQVRLFLDFLSNLGGERVLTCLGNHDVRRNGMLSEDFRLALQIPQTETAVTWLDDRRVGLVIFNSVIGGRLARGKVGDSQMQDIGSAIDQKQGNRDYRLIGMIHHHPVRVPLPDWYARPYYERLFGKFFGLTDELEDSTRFVGFVDARRFRFLIHGHKHIPHISSTPAGKPIFGCGSSVGKIGTVDGSTYMSINVITFDARSGRVTARLLAERIPGAGLKEYKRHEFVSSSADT